MNFADKVVLVTGASSGLGQVTAESFAKHGSYVAITGRNQANLDKVEKSCRDKGAKDVLQINVEFADVAAVKAIVEKVIAKFKKLDILINNAGIAAIASLSEETEESFDLQFTVNVKSLLFLTQKAMPHLVETKGCVVNVSSILSFETAPQFLSNAMTKAASDYFTRTIALEYAPKGVRVNSVNPGIIRNNSLARIVGQEKADQFYAFAPSLHPMGRLGETEEIAKAILFLASEDSSWTTGHCLSIDGGRRVRTAT